MSLHQDLLDQALALARLDPNRPKQANLRRAVSSAYYSLYHYLIDQACRSAIGTHHRDAHYRQVIARGFDHGSMKSACRAFAGGTLPRSVSRGSASGFVVSSDLRNLSQAFVSLQEQRHLADYDLTQQFSREDALRG